MNIVTQKLVKQVNNPSLKEFVSHWDSLEGLVVNVYRTNYATAEDEVEYLHLRNWLDGHYLDWQEALRPHWQGTRIAGEAVAEDPYKKLLAFDNASDISGSWGAMRTLPAAREALNSLLLSIIAEGG